MNKPILGTAIIMLIIGIGLGYMLTAQKGLQTSTDEAVIPLASTTKEPPLFYRNSMNPSVTSPLPAKDSMGMDYVPVYAQETDKKAVLGTVKRIHEPYNSCCWSS